MKGVDKLSLLLCSQRPVISVDSHWSLGIVLSIGLKGHFHIRGITSEVVSVSIVDAGHRLYHTTELGGGGWVDLPRGAGGEPLKFEAGHGELVVVTIDLTPPSRRIDPKDVGHDALELEAGEAVHKGGASVACN